MKAHIRILFIITINLSFAFSVLGQNNKGGPEFSGNIKKDSSTMNLDTVIIKKPYIIHQYFYANNKVLTKRKNIKLDIEHSMGYYVGPLSYKNKFCNCPEYGDYLISVRARTSELLSYEVGLMYQLKINSFVGSIGANFTSIKEQYIHPSTYVSITSSGITSNAYKYKNDYNYLCTELSIGYIYSLGKFSFSTIARATMEKLIHANAAILDPNGSEEAVDINSLKILSKTVYLLGAALRVSYNFTPKSSIGIEPYYRSSINSMLDTSKIFSLNRNFSSLRIVMIHQF